MGLTWPPGGGKRHSPHRPAQVDLEVARACAVAHLAQKVRRAPRLVGASHQEIPFGVFKQIMGLIMGLVMGLVMGLSECCPKARASLWPVACQLGPQLGPVLGPRGQEVLLCRSSLAKGVFPESILIPLLRRR